MGHPHPPTVVDETRYSLTCLVCVPIGVKMLVDPWLVGNLTFADQEWLYKGTKTAPMPTIQDIEASTDFILLSQVDFELCCETIRLLLCALPRATAAYMFV